MQTNAASPYAAALAAYQAGQHAAAEAGFTQVLAKDAQHTAALYHLGLALHAQGRTQEGIAHYQTLLQRYPENLHAWINLGDLHGKAGQPEQAISSWEQALQLDSDSVLVLNNIAITCANLGRRAEAVVYFRRAASIEPNRHALWFSLGNALMGLARYNQAESAFVQALRIDPAHGQTHNNLAVTLGHLKREDEAIAQFRKALAVDADLADGLNNLALALYGRDAREEALQLLRHCVDRHPGYALAWANLGMVLQGMGQLSEAVRVIDRALELEPNQAGWLWNQSLAYLTMGDFERGWQHFEARYAPGRADPVATLPKLSCPMWTGEDLAGKRILLVKEQGFGDQIQCLRFVQPLLSQGAHVGVWVHPAMVILCALVAGVGEVLTEPPVAENYDYWALMMSLPAQLKAGFDNLPGHYPYIVAPTDAADTANTLRGRIDHFAQGRLKVGINWAGNPSHPNDRHRSLQVADIAAWLDMPQIAWVSLQTSRDPATDTWVKRGNLLPLGDSIQSFGDTVSIVAALDLVLSIDSAVAHLAGAMGVRTWLLLPANPDYRWMLERTDSPWYPSVLLWRQKQLGAWAATLAQVERALRRETGVAIEANTDASDESGNPWQLQGANLAQFLPLAGHQRLIRARHGWFVYNRHDQYVGQALQHYGEYAEYEVHLFARILQGYADADAIEVGANMGAQTVPLARMARHLWAFEPQPTVFQTLCANLALNDVRNTQAFPYGVSDVQGMLVLPAIGYDTDGNFGGVSLAQEGQGMPVRVVTLDEFLPDFAPDLRVRLLKVDVEGMERAVLAGARQLIDRDRPLLYVENDRIEQSAELIVFMRSLGYRVYWHCPLLYNPANFFSMADNIYFGIAAINMLGVPKEQTFDTTGMREVGAAHEHILQQGQTDAPKP